jgi:deoxyinosine 3'endonuclease (endonuclease V)
MKIKHIHPWQCDYREAVVIQNGLREKLVLKDDGLQEPIRTVAGADIFLRKGEQTSFSPPVIVLDYTSIDRH